MPIPITVHKLNPQRQETWQYSGEELRRSDQGVLLQASFNRDDSDFHGIPFKRGDRFVEAYFFERWYNVFEIYDRDDGRLKGWYCNVTMPIEVDGGDLRYVDLALDLLVFPDGRQLVLDEDEFEALEIDVKTRQHALQALEDLKSLVKPANGFRLETYFS